MFIPDIKLRSIDLTCEKLEGLSAKAMCVVASGVRDALNDCDAHLVHEVDI